MNVMKNEKMFLSGWIPRRVFFIPVMMFACVGSSSMCAGQEAAVKTEKGLRFAVPDDWPIEERNGAVAPVPVEEYVTKKFKKIEERLSAIEKNSGQQSGSAKDKAVSSVIKSGTDAQDVSLQEQMDALSKDVAALKAQTDFSGQEEDIQRTPEEKVVSDKNIAEQIRLIKKRLEDIERRLGVVEFHQDI